MTAGEPAALIVEEADGKSVGMLTKQDDLETLMGRLSRQGERERGLLGALKKHHESLKAELGSHPVILDPPQIPRWVARPSLMHMHGWGSRESLRMHAGDHTLQMQRGGQGCKDVATLHSMWRVSAVEAVAVHLGLHTAL